MSSVIVVGGGLSGLSAAHTILERGGRVVVVEKMPFLGGNSTKATSGINGALTKTQIKLGIKDSAEKFYEDTAHSARDLLRPELAKVLTYNSASAVEWLQDKFNLDLSLVSRLGGHSFPRTHRGKERFPGMTITYALMEKLEDIAKAEPTRVRLVKKARVTKLLQDANGNVIGVEFDQEGKVGQELGPVILATGGYAADFAPDGLLKQIRPDLIHLPTTNGDWSTGDGIKLTRAIGGNTVDLEKVQVHPTGLVDPNEPDAKVKFLAAEALRGCGGLLFDANGKRFADELGHRDYVTGQMWKNKGPFRLILNGAAAKEIEWHCKHYMGRGLMKHFKNGKELAAEMGVSVDVIATTMQQYNEFAKNNNDPFGKKYFHNLPFDINDEFYVSIVTPVLHFTMGGLEINHEGQVLRANKTPINGLFASGEVCGGVHGANRLGGSSLLGCVVYGRVAGETASKYFFSQLIENPQSTAAKRLGGLSNQLTGNAPITATINHNGIQTTIEVEPDQKRVAFNITWDGRTGQPTVSAPTVSAPVSSAPSAEPTAAPVQEKKGGDKEYTWEEVAKHNSEKDCWVVVNGQVLDVTNFLKDHPGGKKAILIFAGRDATDEFNMLHKPDVVEKYAPEAVLGKIKGGAAPSHAPAKSSSSSGKATQQAQASPKSTLKMAPSDVESPVSGGTAHVLPQERAKATFDVEKMTNYLDGSAEQTKRRRFIIGVTKNSDHPDKNNWGPVEQLREHVKHFLEIHEPYWDTWTPTREEIVWMSEYSMFQGSMMNHYGLFLPTLTVHASDEQRNWWWKKALSMKIVGCYAQTELGHGSNVRGLRTIAEFDKKTQEFVLNTPTLTAMKWWPGTLGKVATHALVYAQLIIDGKELGVHSFMLQIRDENHKPFPGIEVGDLGPKLGDNANDTGFMRLTNVRIPREFMLARYQQVTPDGQYVKSPEKEKNMKLGYTTMIFTRGAMVKSAGTFLARAATIATRYSCVRKQGFVDTKKANSFKSAERQIIDHQVQRYRVFRQIAMAYAMKFTGSWMINKFKEMEGTDRTLKNFDLLPEIAATSGGLKALCTYLAWSGIEDCRKCCGGNGYLMASGVAPLAANYVWQTTAEGDWIVLMLQTGMFLMKVLSNVAQGKSTSETFAYLEPLKQGLDISSASAPTASSTADFSNPDFLLSLFRHLALVRVALAGQEFQAKLGELNNFNEAVNATALELCAAVRAHCFCFMLTNFVKAVKHAPDAQTKDVLTKVCALFATSTILDDSVWSGVLTSSQVQLAKQATGELLNAIRPNCVALVDAFDIPDRVLGSAIGKYDGNVYEALWESAQRSPLNQKDPFDGYHEYLSPHLDKELLKNPNTVPKM